MYKFNTYEKVGVNLEGSAIEYTLIREEIVNKNVVISPVVDSFPLLPLSYKEKSMTFSGSDLSERIVI